MGEMCIGGGERGKGFQYPSALLFLFLIKRRAYIYIGV
jgi:hypothetical protein